MNDRIWILGAPDPEMEQIERLLRECGEQIIYATGEDGRRVHPGNAYRCPVPEVPEGSMVYAVECIDVLPDGWVRIDHHRPRDPGYAKPPVWFFEASSIGQVLTELAWLGQLPDWPEAAWPYRLYGRPRVGVHEIRWSAGGTPRYVACVAGNETREVHFGQALSNDEWSARDVYTREPVVSRICEIPEEYLLAAAADHCLAAAYRGECPGVDPDALMRWRVETRAAHQGRAVEDVLADVERARTALREAPVVSLAEGIQARDLRGPAIPELPEAAAREGECFLASIADRDGRIKVVCQSGAPEQIEAFMRVWAPREGLVDIYGDSARGFAGGYLAT